MPETDVSKTIFDLTNYTADEISGSRDLLFITDATNLETKKITPNELAIYLALAISSYTGSFTGSVYGQVTGSLLGTSSFSNYSTTASYYIGAGEGDIVTASNAGNQGVGVFKDKTGNSLNFYNITPGTGISINLDNDNSNIQISTANGGTVSGFGSVGSIQYNSSANTTTGDANLIWYSDASSLSVVGQITASGGLIGTSSWATSASAAISSSYANRVESGSVQLISSSYARYAGNANTASHALSTEFSFGTSGDLTFPSVGGTETKYAHGLPTVPKFYRWVAVLNSADSNNPLYDVGDEVDLSSFFNGNGFSDDDTVPAFAVYADINFVYAVRSSFATLYLISPSGTVTTTIDSTKWRLKCYILG